MKDYTLSVKEVIKKLRTTRQGLAEEEAKKRLERYGLNKLKKEKRITTLEIFLSQFKSLLVVILIIAAFIAFFLKEYIDSSVIFAIVAVNAVLGFVQEYKAEKAMEALKKLAAPKAVVIRDKKQKKISAEEVVPGDLIILEEGEIVPADSRIMEVVNLKIEEAVLTGESLPSLKFTKKLSLNTTLADRENMAYSSTTVVYGRGKAVVTATGMNTEFGKIAKLVQETKKEETPLQIKLTHLGKVLGILILLISIGIFAVGILTGGEIFEMFMTAVSLAISAIPEGLPAVVTITLALGMQLMARKNAIVKKLSAVETLGCVAVICSDKTGTLTKDEMTVKEVYANDKNIEVTGSGYIPKGDFLLNKKEFNLKDKNLLLLLETSVLCNNAKLVEEHEGWKIIGDPTEGALIVLAEKAGIKKQKLLKTHYFLTELPFDSRRKRMTAVYRLPSGKEIAYLKGAPEVVLKLCSRVLKKGKEKILTKKGKEKILKKTKEMAEKALRVLVLAYRDVSGLKKFDIKNTERNLVFIGLVGMMDPPRPEVPDSIKKCMHAGIKPIVITGDHKDTAIAIAKQIGIFKKGDKAITGNELDNIPDKKFKDVVDKIKIYARTSPEHKVRICKALKQKGYVVAMTGDGVNDAPALKNADIGISMGIKGTDVTRETSDMVLEDDNFATIVGAVERGRAIYDNIRKFVKFLLSANFAELVLVTITAFIGLPLPIIPAQILWINLVTDGLPALALGVEKPEEDIMERKPRHPKESILKGMLVFLLVTLALNLIAEMAIYFGELNMGTNINKVRTMVFTTIVFFELFFVFNCRSEKKSVFRNNPLSNKKLVIAVLISVFLQMAVIYIPFMQTFFKTVPLSLMDWLKIIGISSIAFLILPEVLHKK